MHTRTSTRDVSRHSVSTPPSCSSHTSGPDDIESLGDVYVWGEIWSDGISQNGNGKSLCSKADVLLPKALECNVVIDVHQIACGFRHAAFVTRQGEVFTWGEECCGRLGHGIDIDRCKPHLVESLALSRANYVACGEYHTCAITTKGDLFIWGDWAYNNEVTHWLPKRVYGPLEGIEVFSVACGSWHIAFTTTTGKIYTFGDGAFGVLGHGDRENVVIPKEIESLSGLRTICVACGVWHMAAIVEVMGHGGANVISQKLFTWGDGDEYRLGHGDKEARLVPTCIASLIDYNFHQVSCGHNMTVALSTSGHVFTMGSSVHGELGNPQFDGKVPCLVQDRLVGEIVEEIACGSHHVVALTSRSEVFTWGKGANGRLGHGDVDDRKTPLIVQALKDRHVKSISCGSNFTACICIHKWVSSADQSVCTGCRQAFGFTRKRHNCYNCGLVYCHACSSKKVLKAVLAPTPGKPHRVCDSCFSKLWAAETVVSSNVCRRNVVSHQSVDSRENFDKGRVRYSRLLLAPKDLRRYGDLRYGKRNRNYDVTSRFQMKEIVQPNSMSLLPSVSKPNVTPMTSPSSPIENSRVVSPYSWKPNSLVLSSAPDFSGRHIETLKNTIEHLDREVLKLQGQVKSLKQKLEQQDAVTHKASKEAKEAAFVVAQESAKFNDAVEFINTIETQMKIMEGKLPEDQRENLKSMSSSIEIFLKNNKTSALIPSSSSKQNRESTNSPENQTEDSEHFAEAQSHNNIKSAINDIKESADHRNIESSSRSPRSSTRKMNSKGEIELTEQFEPGVYVTALQQSDGVMFFKRIKFSKRRFSEQEAEEWWRRNQEKVFNKYNPAINVTSNSSSANTTKEVSSYS